MIRKNNTIIENTFKNFMINYKSMILFEILYKLIVISIVIPITELIKNIALFNLGKFNLTNTSIAKHLLSVPILIAIICMLIVSFIAIFIELATIIYIANESRENKKTTYLQGLLNSVQILKKSKSIYIVPMVILLGIIGPFTNIINTSLIKNIKIPAFIKGEIFKMSYGKLIFHSFTIILILAMARWIYSIIAMVIEDISLKKSFKNSTKINRNSKGKTIYYILLWSICSIAIKLAITIIYFVLIYTLLTIIDPLHQISKYVFYISVIVFIIGYSFISVITTPLFITFLLELYYKYKNYKVKLRDNIIKLDIENSKLISKIKINEKIFNTLTIGLFTISIFILVCTTLIHEYGSNINITAHRGSSLSAPENSMSSIQYAINENADYVEIDVMTTKDNEVVVFHDSTLKRIANSNKKIKDMTLKEVKQIDNGLYFSKEFRGERIPTLEEVFKSFKGKVRFNIELKTTSKYDNLSNEVARLIKEYNMEDQVVVSSLNEDTITKFENENSEIESGYIISFGIGDLSAINVDFISVEYDLLSYSLVELMHMYEKKVHVWTLNDRDRIIRAINLGVDNIITDNVVLAKKSLYDSKYKEYIIPFLIRTEGISYSIEEYEKYGEYIDYILNNLNYRTWFRDIIKDIIMEVNI